MIPDDPAGRPLTPTELATIAELERRLLDAPAPVRRPGASRRRPWYRSANAAPLVALLGVGVLLGVVAVLAGGGLLGAAAVLASVAVTAFAWPLLPTALGGPRRPRRRLRFTRPPRRG